MDKNSKLLVILTGKTASGKDTAMSKLLSRLPGLKRIVSSTSRPSRNNEQDRVDYNFISKACFKQKIDKEDFIEYVEYGGNLYGTEKAQIINNLDSNLIWRIDPSRAGEAREFINRTFPADMAKELIKRIIVIYITVPDKVVLKRLKKRHLPKAEIEKRMADDKKIWEQYKGKYDFIVENVPGKLDETVSKIISIIK